jgi:predicted peptidase
MLNLPRFIIVMTLVWAAPGLFADDMATKNQTAHTFKGKTSEEVSMQYLLFLPKDYQEKGEKKWPLMLFLHGAGERGTNLAAVTMHGPPKIVKTQPDFPFVLVSPQCPSGQIWSAPALLALLDDVLKNHNVDPNRVYLTGLSMGGFGTWTLGLRYPERFAALVPICGGGNSLDVLLPDPKKAARLKKIPVWAFHGAKDPVVKLEESQRMVDSLHKIGNEAKLTVYPEAQHDSWTEAYNTKELYDWLLQQKLTASRRFNRPKVLAAHAQ